MTVNCIQSEAGNITVAALGHNLVIWVDGFCYMVTNPSTTDPIYQHHVKKVEFETMESEDALKAKIDAVFEEKSLKK